MQSQLILADQQGHQFIIATHSPIVITAARPERILRTTRQASQTKIEALNLAETENLKLFLADIGARLSDVFGAERILWVDGETEENCFPEIIKKCNKKPHYGTKVLGVKQTGDFEGKHSRTVLDIYSRLSKGEGLLPPAIGFLFDRERRSFTQRDDLERQGKGLVAFLERRMFENYLLNPLAIADVIQGLPGFREEPVTAEEVELWIENNKFNPDFISLEHESTSQSKWLAEVHGGKLLSQLFESLSETRFCYNKLEHGLKLTRYILKHSPNDFLEIANKIETLIEPSC